MLATASIYALASNRPPSGSVAQTHLLQAAWKQYSTWVLNTKAQTKETCGPCNMHLGLGVAQHAICLVSNIPSCLSACSTSTQSKVKLNLQLILLLSQAFHLFALVADNQSKLSIFPLLRFQLCTYPWSLSLHPHILKEHTLLVVALKHISYNLKHRLGLFTFCWLCSQLGFHFSLASK